MDIEIIKEKKKELERTVSDLFYNFEKETGTVPDDVEVVRQAICDSFGVEVDCKYVSNVIIRI